MIILCGDKLPLHTLQRSYVVEYLLLNVRITQCSTFSYSGNIFHLSCVEYNKDLFNLGQ